MTRAKAQRTPRLNKNANSKHEIRNTKQIIITKIQMFKTIDYTVWNFGHSNFDIVSDFDIRISNLKRDLFRVSIFEIRI